MFVHRARLDAERSGDLFGIMVCVNQPQAFPFALRQHLHGLRQRLYVSSTSIELSLDQPP